MFLDIFNQKRETYLDKVDQLSCPFNLFNNKKLFWLKLNQLLCQSNKQPYLNCLSALSAKIRSLHKAEKARKNRWLIKRAKNEFSVNLYKVGKKLLDPKCYCSLNVDQKALDQHKSSNLVDKNFNIPLAYHLNLLFWKKSIKVLFLVMIFLKSYWHVEMPLHLV